MTDSRFTPNTPPQNSSYGAATAQARQAVRSPRELCIAAIQSLADDSTKLFLGAPSAQEHLDLKQISAGHLQQWWAPVGSTPITNACVGVPWVVTGGTQAADPEILWKETSVTSTRVLVSDVNVLASMTLPALSGGKLTLAIRSTTNSGIKSYKVMVGSTEYLCFSDEPGMWATLQVPTNGAVTLTVEPASKDDVDPGDVFYIATPWFLTPAIALDAPWAFETATYTPAWRAVDDITSAELMSQIGASGGTVTLRISGAEPGPGQNWDLWVNTNSTPDLFVWVDDGWYQVVGPSVISFYQLIDTAQIGIDHKISTYVSATAPIAPAAGFAIGDLWMDTSNDNLVMRWNGTAWVALHLGGGAISDLPVDKLTTGVLQAGVQIIAGDPLGNYASMMEDGFRTYAVSDDGTQYEATRFGTPDGNAVQIVTAPGQPPTATINPDGSSSFLTSSFEQDIIIAGRPLTGPTGWIFDLPLGLVAQTSFLSTLVGGSVTGGSSTIFGVADISLMQGRAYEFNFAWRGYLNSSSGRALVSCTAKLTTNDTGSWPAEPGTSDPNLWEQSLPVPAAAASNGFGDTVTTTYYVPPGATTDGYRRVKIALQFSPTSGTLSFDTSGTTSPGAYIMSVTDIGPAPWVNQAYAPGGTGANIYVSIWEGTTSHTYVTTTGAIRTADDTNHHVRCGSGASSRFHSIVNCGSTALNGETTKSMVTALTGATITKAEIFLYSVGFPENGGKGQAVFRQRTGTGVAPSTSTTGWGGTEVPLDFTAVAQGKWVTVPNSWFGTGATGFFIGPANWFGPSGYGYYVGAGNSNVAGRPKVRLTYSR